MFRKLTAEQKALIVADALDRYLHGTELRDIAPYYNVHEKTLYKLIVRTDPEGWWSAQHARYSCDAMDAFEDRNSLTFRQMKSKVRAADHHLERLERNRYKVR